MNWNNVRHIFWLSFLGQLRDRRMVLLYVVLPLLIYPIMGLAVVQVSQFVNETPLTVGVINAGNLPSTPPLLEGDGFAPDLFFRSEEARLLLVEHWTRAERPNELPPGAAAALYLEPDFSEQLAAYRESIFNDEMERTDPPRPVIIFDASREESNTARRRLLEVVNNYGRELAREQVIAQGVPADAIDSPLDIKSTDVAVSGDESVIIWARIFPLLFIIWAMTGAFHPAVDLCPGEKERGTLETLLCSPAGRMEIVYGKLLTIMLYSAGTVVLNLVSMSITGLLLLRHLPGLGPPPMEAAIWLALALPLVTLFFSALCLAISTNARSTAEGHYYMMPLFLMLLPITMAPLAPGVNLSLGLSLVPVGGVVSLLRTLIEGNYELAAKFAAPVLAVTIGCAWISLRWAESQFKQEAVLFRAGERVDVFGWARRFYQERGSTPGVRAALGCGIGVWVSSFVLQTALPQPTGPQSFFWLTIISQLGIVAVTLVFTVLRARSFRRTLLLRLPVFWTIPLAVIAALAWHPISAYIAEVYIRGLFPVDPSVAEGLHEVTKTLFDMPVWQLLIPIALMPAICEEVAFRGFILTGLRKLESPWKAIGLTALLFGLTHIALQQSVMATLTGVILGWIAWHSQSLLPCVLFHFTNNALVVLVSTYGESWTWLTDRMQTTSVGGRTVSVYEPAVLWPALGILVGCLVLFAFSSPEAKRREVVK